MYFLHRKKIYKIFIYVIKKMILKFKNIFLIE